MSRVLYGRGGLQGVGCKKEEDKSLINISKSSQYLKTNISKLCFFSEKMCQRFVP